MCAGGSGILLSLTLMPTYSRAREFERTSIGNVAQLQPNTYTSFPFPLSPARTWSCCCAGAVASTARTSTCLHRTVPTPKSIPNPVSSPSASPCPPWVTPPPKSVEAAAEAEAAVEAAAVRCHTEAGAPLPLWLRVHHAAASTAFAVAVAFAFAGCHRIHRPTT